MGVYDSGGGSPDGRDEDDEEEYEESGGGNRFLGFMFGNVDDSGDLDADYLDEDAKENLAAVADKLGSSLTEIELSVKSPDTSVDAAEQDYNKKAETAVDYQDIDEDYDGPEIQTANEEDHLLPKKEYFSSHVSFATTERGTSAFDDENYDEDEEEEVEKEHVGWDKQLVVQTTPLSDQQRATVVSGDDEISGYVLSLDSADASDFNSDAKDMLEEEVDDLDRTKDDKHSAPLPILCVEEGSVILRFSEMFGNHEPLKKEEKRDHRYSICKERYTSLKVSDIVEEDEETFLKSSGKVDPLLSCVVRYDISASNDDGWESFELGVSGSASQMLVQNGESRKNTFPSAQQMIKDLTLKFSKEWQSSLCSKFYPLDQLDWEEGILWNNSPPNSEKSTESRDDSEINTEGEVVSGIGSGDASGANINSLELPMGIDEKDHDSLFHSSHVLLESFGSGDSIVNGRESRFHPQLLRLESLSEMDKNNDADGTRDNALELGRTDVARHFSKLTLQNRDMVDGSWLDDIIWDQREAPSKPKLILNLQDEHMLFELLDHRDSEHLQLHAGAMIMAPPPKSRVSPDLPGHGFRSGWQFNIANDKFYMSRKVSQQLQSNPNKRTVLGVKIHHSAPAIKLQTMKLKLSNKDLANFHRPKGLWYPHDNEVAVKEQGKLPTVGPMKIILKSLGGKGSRLHVDAQENVSSVKEKASKKLDFKSSESVKIFYLGKELEDNKSLAAQKVQPNSLLHLVRTKMYLWPRAQRIPGENKSLRPPGAFKKKSDLCVKDGHIFLMEYCEERPLLLSNPGMGANLRTYYQKSNPKDQNGTLLRNGNSALGNVITLEPNDKSPFLGDIKVGSSQSSLETNMYRAPVFSHKVPATDFLLVRSAKGKLSIRRVDKIAVVGQQEPLMEVLAPLSKNLQIYITNRLMVHVYREFRAAEKRGMVPWIRADELQAQFAIIPDTILRKKLKECAVLRRDANGHLFWSKKREFIIPSEEELKKMVLPEHVCAYESMQAGLYHLKHLGITRLTLPASISTAMSQLPDEAITLAAASHIERELQITPWSLSGNFVACRNQDRETIERLEITGVGDPSGRGLGFSYVRAAPKSSMSNAMAKKKTAAGRGGTTVTGTDADLRRLSMEAAREVLLKFNVPDEQIAKQTRWHRIAMIRKLSSEQPATGVQVDPTTFSKYARGQRMSFLQLQQQAREKCQEIWDRQVQSLSAVDGDEIESDSEAHSDLDSFAGDLENLLDAEEHEGDERNYEAKNDKADGIKGLKMRRHPSQAQAAEEIEDEAAEAAELCRLLMDDNETEQKKKKPKPAGAESRLLNGAKSNFSGNTEKVKKIISKAQSNGSYPPMEDNISDSKELETLFNKRKTPEKVKAAGKNGTPIMPQLKTKVKILGDGFKLFKEKKSAREKFSCSACGQLGHMKTNKNCPRYGEEPDTVAVVADSEKASGKSDSLDPSNKPQKKLLKKKSIATKTKKSEEGEKSAMKEKVPVKFKCGSSEPLLDIPDDEPVKGSDEPVNSDVGAASVPVAKVKKIKISTKAKSEDVEELQRPAITIQPPGDVDRSQNESHRLSVVVRTPTSTDREHADSHRPSIVIVPPAEKKQPQKKLVIKQRKEILDMDQEGNTSFENQKTRRMVELSSLVGHRNHGAVDFVGDSGKKKAKMERMWWEAEESRRSGERLWEAEESRRSGERLRKEKGSRVYDDDVGYLNEEEMLELRRYEEDIRMEREEEERQKAKKKKKKKKPEFSDDYFEDFRTRRNDRRMAERDRGVKRRPIAELARSDNGPVTKRRRGGEVLLANTLEAIVDTLRSNTAVSYLFLRPVTKKEAPDYYDIIDQPMDLSTIKTKVKKMEYKDREEFRHDVWQITFNAHRYNDKRNPGIPPLADQLLELCDYLLKEREDRLDEAEASIENLREF